ncbi:hypothetical protein PPYR_07125 [Photinus pyralis]|uniref:Cytochrome b5 heme-binding domain-containing protein n=1 Tax=Photinus pyralis TaxID=7054 RepID=A0A1Y1MHU3_PHOPY|nr:cytochrome b5-like [Photinus pyralis]KAB0799245.1 hypothetical protein PPYR_07125 [Photinus pyralis]
MTETVYYKIDEIKQNDGKNKMETWIIFKDCVYDVTEFLAKDEHPGGVELIQEFAGKCATKAFLNVGHSRDATRLLATFKIGEVAQEDRTTDATKLKTNNGVNRIERSFISRLTCGILS